MIRRYTPENAKPIPQQATKVFAGTIYDVYQWEQAMFDGSTKTFEMLKRPDTVEVIGVVDGKILLNDELQPDRTERFLAIPGGRHDEPQEDELQAAKREMREETGYEFQNWKLVAASQDQPKIDRIVYVFLATDPITQGEQQLDAGEQITVRAMSLDEIQNYDSEPELLYCPHILREVASLDNLLNLPALHNYK